ncbi:MAG TPA: DMT family transporter [Pengzhenrongella sp.]
MAAAGVTVVLWASAFVVIRVVGAELSPGPMALARVTVAALALTVPTVLSRRGRPLLPRGRTLIQVFAYAAAWFAGYNVALNAAERHIDAGAAALVVNIAPLLIAVGAVAFLSEQLSRPLLLGCLVAFGGVALMATGAGSPGHNDSVGLVLGVVAAVLYAGAVLIQKVILRDLDGLHATWLGCLVGAIALLPFAPQLLAELPTVSGRATLGVVYLGVFPTAVAFTTWAYALNRVPAGRLGPIGYLVTVVSVTMSWLVLSEVPTAQVLVGGAVCLAGVAISRWHGRN